MAVVVDAFDLVIRADAVTDVRGFVREVPNRTFCTDGSVLRVSFMSASDRDAFVLRLAVPPSAVARVDRHALRGVTADWLETGQYAGVGAAWLRGNSPEPLVVPMSWSPAALAFHSPEDVRENFEFIGVENNVEVYRDKRTGEKLYAGRTQTVLSPAKADELEAMRARGRNLVAAHIIGKKDLGFFERRRVKKGVALLEQVLREVPDHWSTLWTLGMSLRALGEHARAVVALRRAYELVPGQPDVEREYAGQCFILGEAEEGLRVSRELHARFPADIGLHSNLALALLIRGDLDEALVVASEALARDRSDPVTAQLVEYIRAVKGGTKSRPLRMPGY